MSLTSASSRRQRDLNSPGRGGTSKQSLLSEPLTFPWAKGVNTSSTSGEEAANFFETLEHPKSEAGDQIAGLGPTPRNTPLAQLQGFFGRGSDAPTPKEGEQLTGPQAIVAKQLQKGAPVTTAEGAITTSMRPPGAPHPENTPRGSEEPQSSKQPGGPPENQAKNPSAALPPIVLIVGAVLLWQWLG